MTLESTPAFERDRDAGARLGGSLREEEPRRVGYLGDAVSGHLEAADLVGRPEAVLEGADEAQRRLPVAFEVAHDVDEVLEHPGACDLSVFRDVADDDDRQVAVFRDADQRRRDLAHLARLPGSTVDQRR